MLEMLEAARVAASAGAQAIRSSSLDARTPTTKSSAVDLVTPTDVASGVAVLSSLLKRYPDARFVIEEEEVFDQVAASPGSLDDPEVWVVDPLDGTTSFVHGYPFYSVSVALMREGCPVLGVVLDVPSRQTFAAARGHGATCDDSQIGVSDVCVLDQALLMTGFPYDRGATLTRQLSVFGEMMRTIHGVRRDGSAALDLCHVAAGRADGFWEFGLSPWDTAAGVVILEEAGGVVTDVTGGAWTHAHGRGIVAANRRLHPRILEIVREFDPEQV